MITISVSLLQRQLDYNLCGLFIFRFDQNMHPLTQYQWEVLLAVIVLQFSRKPELIQTRLAQKINPNTHNFRVDRTFD